MSDVAIVIFTVGCLGVVGLFVAGFGWLWLQASKSAEQDRVKLSEQGVSTEAEVVNQRTVEGRRSFSYYITFQYFVPQADGTKQEFTSEEQIRSDDYRSLHIGDHVGVRYLPDSPKTRIIESGAQSVYTPGTMRIGGIVSIVLGIGVILFGILMSSMMVNANNNKSATSIAYEIKLSATPNTVQKTATWQAATATMQADQAIAAQIRQALEPRIADWKKVTDQVMHRVLPPETDLGLREMEIDYGYCPNGNFYTYVWLYVTDRLNLGYEIDTFFEGYGYVDGAEPAKCYPKELSEVWNRNAGSLGDGWFVINGATDVKTTPTK